MGADQSLASVGGAGFGRPALCTCFGRSKAHGDFFDRRKGSIMADESDSDAEFEANLDSKGKLRKSLQRQYLSSSSSSSTISPASDSDLDYEEALRQLVRRKRSKVELKAEYLSDRSTVPVPVRIKLTKFGHSIVWHEIDPQNRRPYRDCLGALKFARVVKMLPHVGNASIVQITFLRKNTEDHGTMWFKFADANKRHSWQTSVEAIWRNTMNK